MTAHPPRRACTYLEHFALRARPFESADQDDFFYPGPDHIEALERLLYLVRDGDLGFGLLTGEIGAGKTAVLQQLERQLQRERGYEVILLPNGGFAFPDLLREIIRRLAERPGRPRRRLAAEATRYELLTRFSDLLEVRLTRGGRRLVLIIDEAQELTESTLLEVKALTNLCRGTRASFTVILGGQPELADLVRDLPQIQQRVGLRYHLPALSPEGVGAYLDHRLRAAGGRGRDLFDAEARQALYTCTAGIPREVNRLAKLALDRAFSLGLRTVPARIICSIADDICHQDACA